MGLLDAYARGISPRYAAEKSAEEYSDVWSNVEEQLAATGQKAEHHPMRTAELLLRSGNPTAVKAGQGMMETYHSGKTADIKHHEYMMTLDEEEFDTWKKANPEAVNDTVGSQVRVRRPDGSIGVSIIQRSPQGEVWLQDLGADAYVESKVVNMGGGMQAVYHDGKWTVYENNNSGNNPPPTEAQAQEIVAQGGPTPQQVVPTTAQQSQARVSQSPTPGQPAVNPASPQTPLDITVGNGGQPGQPPPVPTDPGGLNQTHRPYVGDVGDTGNPLATPIAPNTPGVNTTPPGVQLPPNPRVPEAGPPGGAQPNRDPQLPQGSVNLVTSEENFLQRAEEAEFAKARGKELGTSAGKSLASIGPEMKQVRSLEKQYDNVYPELERAFNLIEKHGNMASGNVMLWDIAKTQFLPEMISRKMAPIEQWTGTAAQELKIAIETIRTNIAFDKLQEMRLESPTGGALGQVSDMENQMLKDTLGSLSQYRTPQALQQALVKINKHYKNVARLNKAAFLVKHKYKPQKGDYDSFMNAQLQAIMDVYGNDPEGQKYIDRILELTQ